MSSPRSNSFRTFLVALALAGVTVPALAQEVGVRAALPVGPIAPVVGAEPESLMAAEAAIALEDRELVLESRVTAAPPATTDEVATDLDVTTDESPARAAREHGRGRARVPAASWIFSERAADRRIAHLAERLALTEAQITEVRSIVLDAQAREDALTGRRRGPARSEIRTSAVDRIEAVLTDAQKVELASWRTERAEHRAERAETRTEHTERPSAAPVAREERSHGRANARSRAH